MTLTETLFWLLTTKSLTFVLCLQLLLQKVALPVAEHEGQKGKDEGVQDADDSQDVGPTHRTVPQSVLSRVLSTHVSDHLGVPAVWEDHTAKHQTHGWRAVREVWRKEGTPEELFM